MKRYFKQQSIINIIFFISCLPFFSPAQAPNPALIGYFHNWQDVNSPYIQLDQVDARYNIIDVAFAVPQGGTDYQMEFIPDQVSQATFISQIQTLHNQGRKVLISVGGATAPVTLDNVMERDSFISSMTHIINTFDFDGIDIDFEGSSLSLTGGSISLPQDAPVINLIYAIKQIMANYFAQNNLRLLLTMAPETAFVQGGQSAYGGIWGAYLPVIDALRDSLEILHVQLYNSGTMFGVDGNVYTQGTADFIVAMCEAVIQGFNTTGGMFAGLPASKVAVGLPACPTAAGGGFTDTATVKSAIDYLRGTGPQPGSYSLINPAGYLNLRGMMTWSINWDSVSSCGGIYEYAQNFQNIFGTTTYISSEISEKICTVFPNPTSGILHLDFSNRNIEESHLKIFDMFGEIIFSKTMKKSHESINISSYPAGVYFLMFDNYCQKIIKL